VHEEEEGEEEVLEEEEVVVVVVVEGELVEGEGAVELELEEQVSMSLACRVFDRLWSAYSLQRQFCGR